MIENKHYTAPNIPNSTSTDTNIADATQPHTKPINNTIGAGIESKTKSDTTKKSNKANADIKINITLIDILNIEFDLKLNKKEIAFSYLFRLDDYN
jgi:hypothetical protein